MVDEPIYSTRYFFNKTIFVSNLTNVYDWMRWCFVTCQRNSCGVHIIHIDWCCYKLPLNKLEKTNLFPVNVMNQYCKHDASTLMTAIREQVKAWHMFVWLWLVLSAGVWNVWGNNGVHITSSSVGNGECLQSVSYFSASVCQSNLYD